MESFKKRDAWVIGLAQALALIPGISRSGSTVVAGLLLGLRKELAIRYSFLLSIPIGLGTFVYSAPELAESSLVNEALSAYILVFVVTFFATLLGIKLFVDTLKNNKLIYFALYCWLVGGIALLQPLLFG